MFLRKATAPTAAPTLGIGYPIEDRIKPGLDGALGRCARQPSDTRSCFLELEGTTNGTTVFDGKKNRCPVGFNILNILFDCKTRCPVGFNILKYLKYILNQ